MLPEIFAFPWEGPAIDWSSCSNARMVFEKKRVVKWVFLDKEQEKYNVIGGEKEAKPETYSPSPHAPPRISSACMTSPYDDSPRLRERERRKGTTVAAGVISSMFHVRFLLLTETTAAAAGVISSMFHVHFLR
ncbi:hypothetical protein C4D60_Mb09t04060 [Musa balbisiana]|uniref:Uncharacterized protein n=1 Tax=Musa balbisiana TaxID=52838 RepID=A0A4S8IF77_MUSBA|nr:hypothetical protein C4D60_Mb09t04060 [Musa balbisiana]